MILVGKISSLLLSLPIHTLIEFIMDAVLMRVEKFTEDRVSEIGVCASHKIVAFRNMNTVWPGEISV